MEPRLKGYYRILMQEESKHYATFCIFKASDEIQSYAFWHGSGQNIRETEELITSSVCRQPNKIGS